MAPSKKPVLPTQPPAWLTEFLREFQQIRQDFSRQESASREIRSIALENQHLLRSRFRSNVAQTQEAVRSTISRSVTFSEDQNNGRPSIASTQYNIRAPRAARTVTNESIRNAAVPIPRATRPDPLAVSKICWYHRQFGQASTNCIQPCNFVAPILPPRNQPNPRIVVRISPEVRMETDETIGQPLHNPAENSNRQNQSQILERIPLERSINQHNINQIQNADVAQPSSSSQTTNDWNSLQELYEQSFPSLSDESSSSSDSEDSQPERKEK